MRQAERGQDPARPRARWLCGLVVVCAALSPACERELSERPPPLRPLVYTEANADAKAASDDPGAEAQFRAVHDLGVAIYQALVEHDRERFERVFVTPSELKELIGTALDAGERRVEGLRAGSQPVWEIFRPGHASEEPVGGLGARLELEAFEPGRACDLSASPVRAGETPQMYLNSVLRLRLRGSNKNFTVRVPRIVLTQGGGWKLYEKLEVDNTLRIYLESGMHLKPEMLLSEHYPYPLDVGNYWKYRVIRDGQPAEFVPLPEPVEDGDGSGAAAPGAVVREPLRPRPETVRVATTGLERFPAYGYQLVSFERTHTSVETTTRVFHWLVTPRRVYRCTRDCRQHIDDVSYLLGYMANATPVMIFPLPEGGGWGKAGRSDRDDRYEVSVERHVIKTADGEFASARLIEGSIEEGREERYFVPGTGLVMRKIRSGAGSIIEELDGYRLMP